ncbi:MULTISPECIES: hypothetical protein [unclassified Burkholderia]|uniref:hypothetical protein n=1 Tax=unclassified Burkholderia TaxID=2613784 RepID=UPI001E481BDA|nr:MULTISPECIES: hypothetical protein [unclassified Burkholderia]UEP30383.1 hypothetical protein LMA01_28750 [Burkholderia sp. B21-007]UEP44301.1 hypothetical protein LMA02_30180 [Burkholderia sp. B21-005]
MRRVISTAIRDGVPVIVVWSTFMPRVTTCDRERLQILAMVYAHKGRRESQRGVATHDAYSVTPSSAEFIVRARAHTEDTDPEMLSGTAEVYAHKLSRHLGSAFPQQAEGQVLIHLNDRHLDARPETSACAKLAPLIIDARQSCFSPLPPSGISPSFMRINR